MEQKTRKTETSLEPTKLTVKKKSKKVDSKKTKLTIKELLFCYYYTQNETTRGNATWSYGRAFEYDLDNLSHECIRDEETWDKEKGVAVLGDILEDSEYDKAINICAVEGYKLLRNPKVQEKNTDLLNELLTDRIVDGELAKVIMQDHERPAKVAAIREFNKLKQRIVDKSDITSKGDKIIVFNESQLKKIAGSLLNGKATSKK